MEDIKKTSFENPNKKRFGVGTLAIPLLILSIIFPLQIFNEPRLYESDGITIESNVEVSLGEKILNVFNIPAWSGDNSQGKNYTFIYAYFLFYASLLLGSCFPQHLLVPKINKKMLLIAFLVTTSLLALFYTANSPIVHETTISETGYVNN